MKKRLGQKRLTPRNKKEFTKIAFQIFVNFSLFPKELLLLPPFIRISEGVASASAVYTCLERGTKVFFTFVPRSF
ncbi:hypothetical protein B1P91_06195 [Enterococcus faecium]|nr:hypothetical protein B1P91_06195 [Enterococcus faecium]